MTIDWITIAKEYKLQAKSDTINVIRNANGYPFGLFYINKFNNVSFSEKRFVWFETRERLIHFIKHELPIHILYNFNLSENCTSLESFSGDLEFYFSSPENFCSIFTNYHHNVNQMAEMDDWEGITNVINDIFSQQVKRFGSKPTIAWVGERNALKTSISAELKKHLNAFNRNDDGSWLAEEMMYQNLFTLDTVQRTLFDLYLFHEIMEDDIAEVLQIKTREPQNKFKQSTIHYVQKLKISNQNLLTLSNMTNNSRISDYLKSKYIYFHNILSNYNQNWLEMSGTKILQ